MAFISHGHGSNPQAYLIKSPHKYMPYPIQEIKADNGQTWSVIIINGCLTPAKPHIIAEERVKPSLSSLIFSHGSQDFLDYGLLELGRLGDFEKLNEP
ncbi:MAG: hypothetical protein ACP5QI_00470 [Candidatus Bathyarchaeia archaeon]